MATERYTQGTVTLSPDNQPKLRIKIAAGETGRTQCATAVGSGDFDFRIVNQAWLIGFRLGIANEQYVHK